MKTYALIVAHDEKLGIGKNNNLPWHIKQDLKHFRDLTVKSLCIDDQLNKKTNATIMGRKTWESLPENFRPLPNRINLVISTNSNYPLPSNVLMSKSMEEAINVLEQHDCGNIFVIGGAAIYQMAIRLPIFDTLFITEIEGEYSCDTFFPEYRKDFVIVESSPVLLEDKYRFSFKIFKRKT